MLGLGVLLLLAAGVTFLAVTWDSLPVGAQVGIMATLAAIALGGAVPAARHRLDGTAEALAVLGGGLLIVDLYGTRALGLVDPEAISLIDHIALMAAIVATVNFVLHRLAKSVKTFGITTVVAAQFPVPLLIAGHVNLAVLLLALLTQSVITVLLSAKSTRTVRLTGATCGTLVFTGLTVLGAIRVFLALVAQHDPYFADPFTQTLALSAQFTAVVCLAAATGITLIHRGALPRVLPPLLGHTFCITAAAFTISMFLPQVPTAGRWLTTALATVLTLTLLLTNQQNPLRKTLLTLATTITAAMTTLTATLLADLLHLSLIAALIAVLAFIAAWRHRLDVAVAGATASLAAQAAIVLTLPQEHLTRWTGGIALAVVAACTIAAATRYVGRAPERALLAAAACATGLAEIVILTTASSDTGTGIVLTIAAAPLVAYGLQPARRAVLLIAGALLIIASIAFVAGSGTTTVEWFTLPPAAIMLAIGILRWRDQPSWLFLGPGLLLALAPSTLLANGNDIPRTTLVVAAATAAILIGTRGSLQAPFVLGAAALTKIAVWQLLEVAPLIPRWITLALAGAVLLAVGATYERRLHQAKAAARWITALR
ncbi:hypothetical protein FB561_4967 [Kribbella amoyensis]|uniref:Uncharacterized protein n=1 Tax=Kribbella amoyensis TaxID=996641 RepID=A0A561BY83_9ACTN|nr:hypothetical protein FB561_4967 [Kribbella amoyensis]